MTHRLARALLVPLAIVSAILVGVMSPASADTENHQDPRGDVARIGTARAPFAGIDIVSVHNRFSDGRLVVSTTVAAQAERNWALGIVVVTDDGSRYGGTLRVRDSTSSLFTSAPHPGHGCQETDRFVRNTLILAFTRPCYQGVSSVRVASFATRTTSDGAVFRDDAHRGRLHGDVPLRFGPRLDHTP